jgi:hypothetical protein
MVDLNRAKKANCPNRDAHTEGPAGYVARSEWAEEMAETHVQTQCPGCALWVVWKPKEG